MTASGGDYYNTLINKYLINTTTNVPRETLTISVTLVGERKAWILWTHLQPPRQLLLTFLVFIYFDWYII